MKVKNYLYWLASWILISIVVFLWIWYFWNQNQVISNKDVNFQNLVTQKVNEIRKAIDSLWNLPAWNIENLDKLEKFNAIKQILDTQYFDPSLISGSKMWDNALQAYVAALWDPFTVYLTAKDNETLHKALKWSSDFQWIWAVVTKVPEWIMIEQVIKWGPAFKAWLKPLDIILEANWVDLSKLPLWEAVNKIKWPAGTTVELTIKRDWKVFKIKVKRAKIVLKSVNSKIINYKLEKFGYIDISSVWEETYDEFKNQLNDLLKQHIKGLIVDLRWNWWGYLDIGYKIWATWAKKWQIVVQTKYRNPLYNQIYKAIKTGVLHGFPTVVLIDGYTASAWEIITAAIKENNPKTVKLVWTKTFGKWTIQTLKEFQDGSSLKYTIWKWYTPNGENVCKKWVLPGKWIKPDIEVKFDAKKYKKTLIDNQLEKAKQVLYDMIKK